MTADTNSPAGREGPLAGVRVLDLSRVLAGPFCSMILADLGAEVIKVEEIGRGDQTRTIPPFKAGESHYFLAINRNKRSVAVDLKTPAGRELVLRMAARADIVVENFRPGVLERLGLDYAALKAVKPDLIMCSISGFGQTGPLRTTASFDLISQALSGVMSINGEADGPPTKLGLPMGDIGSGLWAAIGALSGLQHRQRTGQGLQVDLSMLEGLIGLLGYLAEMHFFTGENPGRVGSSHHTIVPYGRFEVADGHIVLALHVGSFWRKFCAAIGREDLVSDPRFRTTADRSVNRAALEEIVTAVLKTRTAAQWNQILTEADVPHAPVHSVGEALAQPVLAARGLIKTVQHPQAGELKVVGSPLNFGAQFTETPYTPAPLLGADTAAVLAELGYGTEEIAALCEAGAIATAQPAARPEQD
ncbi:MAG TPA: CaiB/BaiF CoA-transferase family protein [Burkholderiales bacterium]|jgi:formyl-CoA transferase/CoA:oxalate CoA-transferase|nr:CaiB/BaiF CoA-transferase family protein [Burkholderiales bacterium]